MKRATFKARRETSGTPRVRGRHLQERRALFFQMHPLCAECQRHKRVTPAQELDHVVPLFKGGADEPGNWQGLCKPCHQVKTQRDLGNRPARRIGLDGFPVEGADEVDSRDL